MLFGESIPSPEHSLVEKVLQMVTSQEETLQNSEMERINPFDLHMVALRRHSFTQMFLLFDSLFISKNLLFRFSSVTHRLKRRQKNPNCIRKVHRNMSNDVYIQSSGFF
jgi:DUF438 domain-containing protein